MGNKSKGKTDYGTHTRRPYKAGNGAKRRLSRKYEKALRWGIIDTGVGIEIFGAAGLSERWHKGVA